MVQLKEKVSQMPLVLVEGKLPAWLRNSKGMFALYSSDYNLCVFRCLAVYRGAHKQCNTRQARELARELYAVKGETEPQAMSLSELEEFERYFQLEVALYVVNDEGEWSLYKIPSFEQEEVMRLRVCGNHAFLIPNIELLTRGFTCATCRDQFSDAAHLSRNVKTCQRDVTKIDRSNKAIWEPPTL